MGAPDRRSALCVSCRRVGLAVDARAAATALRVLAGFVGAALGLLVILKILNIGFLALFARPFDLLGDLGEAGDGIETLRATIGRTEANLLIIGAVVLVVALVVVSALAM